MSPNDEKALLRKVILEKRRALSDRERLEKSRAIGQRLQGLEEFQRSRVVHFFLSFRGEVITDGMVRKALAGGRRVVVPVVRRTEEEIVFSELRRYPEEVGPGAYGIPEPREGFLREVDPTEVDLFILPGVVFDLSGNRVGYGGGHYDRILEHLEGSGKPPVPFIALAFELQIVESIPASLNDVKVHKIVTESRIISCRDYN